MVEFFYVELSSRQNLQRQVITGAAVFDLSQDLDKDITQFSLSILFKNQESFGKSENLP